MLVHFSKNLGYDLVGSLLDFASATLNFLADPKQGIKDIIDDFLFNLSELFFKQKFS